MLHLIPPSSASDLCVKAIDSIIKAHGLKVTIKDHELCEVWDLDEIFDLSEPVVLKSFNPIAFHDYLVASEVKKLQDTWYWQVLPTSSSECDQVIAKLECLTERKVRLKLLLNSSYRYWEEVFSNLSSNSKKIIQAGNGAVHLLPELDMSTLAYTLADGGLAYSLLVGRTRLSPEIKAKIKKIIEIFLSSVETRVLIG